MAGGKQSARQKMINLMYLVFIAMIAMTASKEILSAFSLFDKKFENANELAVNSNTTLLKGLEKQAEEKPNEFGVTYNNAKKISSLSDEFYTFLEVQKKMILDKGGYAEEYKEKGLLPAEKMDKGTVLDEAWFTGDRLTKNGDEFVARIEKYKSDIRNVLGEDVAFNPAKETLEARFTTAEMKDKDGNNQSWLEYNFKNFPAVASYTKLTAMQNDIKSTEANLYNVFLGNTVDEVTSLKNYTAIVIPDKNAFFAGETFTGRVVLGKYANVIPTKLKVGDDELDLNRENAIDSTGAARIEFKVGNVGEHDIKGQFTFSEKGQDLPIDFTGQYVVVPRPNSATISADKMNVVYRGVANPMTISFAGVPDNKVRASGAGLKPAGNGKYLMNPGSGREVTISVTATLDDGSPASDKKTFRIKDIPQPTGTISGKDGLVKLPKRNLEIGTIGAKLDDFVFDLPISVTSFKVKVPGQPTVIVAGTKMNSQAKSAIGRARSGDVVTIFDIKAKITGNSSYNLKGVSPIAVEVSN
ncbi:gliding motility protein GldM [Winogradskyella undariae]|uniref:type IX secretion system motor protein PorM/GldM n=1 Tax=Winogradskyella undariae TaxID=1285465 RepID=UPI00156B751A|nr:gliding motility protein GldM [Winogradskyella undariae]NRR91182.1 gliding motility protein GldM [Winogradskyella undariae]